MRFNILYDTQSSEMGRQLCDSFESSPDFNVATIVERRHIVEISVEEKNSLKKLVSYATVFFSTFTMKS